VARSSNIKVTILMQTGRLGLYSTIAIGGTKNLPQHTHLIWWTICTGKRTNKPPV